MKTTQVLASTLIALAAATTGSAFAQGYGQPVNTTNERVAPGYAEAADVGATKSRAEVRSELTQAQGSSTWEDPSERLTGQNLFQNSSEKSRAQVRSEVLQAKSKGSMANPGTGRVPFGTTGRS